TAAQLASHLLGTALWLPLALLIHPLAYGYLSWLLSIATILSTFCTFGLGKTVITHQAAEGDDRLLSSSVAVVFLLSVIAGIIVSIVLGPAVGLLTAGLSLFSLTVHLDLANRKYGSYLRAWIGARLLGLFLPVLFYLFWESINGILVGLALGYLLFGGRVVERLRLKPDIRKIRAVLPFTLGVLGSDLSKVSTSFLDKILIGELFGMTTLGYYHFAYRVFLFFGILPQIMFFYLLSEKAAQRNTDRIEKIAILSSGGLAAATYFFARFIVPPVFPAFAGSVSAIQIMGLAVIPATLVAIKTSGLYAARKANLVLGSHLLALGAGIVGITILGRVFSLVGLALGLLALQSSLAAALFLLPKLTRENRKVIVGSLAVLLLAGLALGTLNARRPWIEINEQEVEVRGLAMGTVVSIKASDPDRRGAQSAAEAAFAEILRIERLLSTTYPASEIYNLNRSGGAWADLSPETLYVLGQSLYYARLSGGAFDPTVKPLLGLWMEEVRTSGRLPTTEELERALSLVNWRALELDEEQGRARFLKEGMQLTLGGIAAGYAVDRATELLKEKGIAGALIDIGGDIRGYGPRTFRIAIQHPRDDVGWLEVIDLKNAAVATTGDYRQFFFLGKRRVHHILDPQTGQPADSVMSVTVVAEKALVTDVLTTTVFVLGPEKGMELMNSHGIAGLIVDAAGQITISEKWE
ncbi:MAG TPA: FAD:protein FMN transferase, partial [Atribacteraceae bacterium]|nr:FAD:protein FMN transferase [Atribacteraceae bacterium]